MSRAGLAVSVAIALASSAGLADAATTPPAGGFASRADKACAAAGAKIVALPAPTAATVLPDLRSNRTILLKLVAQLKSIKAPASKAKVYAAFVASINEHATIIGQTLTASTGNQSAEITRLSRAAAAVTKRSHSQANALGLPDCAKDYAPSPKSTTAAFTTATPAGTPGQSAAVPTVVAAPVATATPQTTGSASTGGSSAAPGATAGSGPSSAAGSSQAGTQTFSGSSSSGQSVNTSGGGVFVTG